MGLFDIFNKTKRKIIPLSLHLGYEQNGEDTEKNGKDVTFANSNDFPEELFDKIIIMIKRLHEMGVYEEKEIVRFIIKYLNILSWQEFYQGSPYYPLIQQALFLEKIMQVGYIRRKLKNIMKFFIVCHIS